MQGKKLDQAQLMKLASERLNTAANAYAHAVCTAVAKRNEPQKLNELLAAAYISGVRDCLKAQEVKAQLHGQSAPGVNPLTEVN